MGQIGSTTATRADQPQSRSGSRRGFAVLSPQFLDELRARVTLSQLIARSVPLKKAGNEFKACCPFHKEKTPSFWVNDQKGFYHCFGCQAHGDAIRFLTESRGLSFIDAVKQLADEVGLDLPKPEPEELARRERSDSLQEILEAAAQHFQGVLTTAEGTKAREYLIRRDLTAEVIADFRIGYAPEGRKNIGRALNRFTTEQLVEVGLLIAVEDKEPYDRFRDRVMVPIKDSRGRVIAFGGRILGDGEPKYLNSPDTLLFDKGRVLYNLDRAGPASRRAERVIVVEGYFDVISLAQAGIREAVAPMGTALTENQLGLLWRLVDEPTLCFDGDDAGQKAAERASRRAIPSLRPGKQLRIAVLPKGKDPDDLVRSGGVNAFEAAISNALPLATFLYRTELQKIDPKRPDKRAGLRQDLEDLARSCPDRLVAEEFGRTFRNLFYEDFGWKPKQRKDVRVASIRTAVRTAPDLARSYIRSALHGLTRFPAVAKKNLEALAAIPIFQSDFKRWRDAVGEAIYLQPDLEDDGIQAIIETDLLPEILQFDIANDLRFGFTRRRFDAAKAARQVETLVNFLGQERALADQLEEFDKAAVIDAGRDKYVAIEVARQRLRETRATLFREAADWNEDAQ